MEDIITNNGYNEYKRALFASDASIRQARRMALELEGVDVYFHNDDPDSCWGRLFIDPFPFKCNMIFDNNDRIISFSDEFLEDFIFQNFQDKSVQIGRSIRKTLRVFKDQIVAYPYQQFMSVKTGRFSWSERLVIFKEGTLRIKTKSNDRFSHGFEVFIEFEDGSAALDDGNIISNIKLKIGLSDLGFNKKFELTPQLLELFNNPQNKHLIDDADVGFKDIIRRDRYYRHDLEEQRPEEEYYASYLFWYMVFNDDTIPKEELAKYFEMNEQNPALKSVMEDFKDDFEGLYSRLEYYDSHPAISFWYCFFDDIMLKNSTLKSVEKNSDLFNLSNPTCLAYHPQKVSDLKKILEERGLRTKKGGGLFHNGILDKLEERLETLGQEEIQHLEVPYIKPTSAAAFIDPRCSSTPLVTENTTMIAQAFTMAWS